MHHDFVAFAKTMAYVRQRELDHRPCRLMFDLPDSKRRISTLLIRNAKVYQCMIRDVCARTAHSGRTARDARSCSCTCLGRAHIALAAGSHPSGAASGLAQGSGGRQYTCSEESTCHTVIRTACKCVSRSRCVHIN